MDPGLVFVGQRDWLARALAVALFPASGGEHAAAWIDCVVRLSRRLLDPIGPSGAGMYSCGCACDIVYIASGETSTLPTDATFFEARFARGRGYRLGTAR